jgi:phosphoglycolate phosphatase-like HAD superfamily hydrolase
VALNNIELAIWDGDNTIWNWMGYAVPAYEAMCSTIAEISGKSFDETAEAMKQFYSIKGTLEDEALIQGLHVAGFFAHLENFDLENCILKSQSAFSKVRREKLKVYQGIPETIKTLNENSLRQIVVTDATRRQAQARLRFSKLEKYFDGIYSMKSAVVPNLPEKFRYESESRVPQFDLPHEKPHVDLERILKMTREEIRQKVAIIGDNMAKDMGLAMAYDCLGIHAAYGASTPDLIGRISKFAPERVASRNVGIGTISNEKIKKATHPGEIIGYIK